MVGHADLADRGEVGEQHRQRRFDLVEQPRRLVEGPWPVLQQGAELWVVVRQLPGDAGQATRPRSDRVGGLGLRVEERPGVFGQGSGAVGDAVEVTRDFC